MLAAKSGTHQAAVRATFGFVCNDRDRRMISPTKRVCGSLLSIVRGKPLTLCAVGESISRGIAGTGEVCGAELIERIQVARRIGDILLQTVAGTFPALMA